MLTNLKDAQRYELVAPVGTGSFGTVFKARDRRSGRSVAVKCLTDALRRDPIARDDLLTEGRIASTLTHPNVCPVREVGVTEDGCPFLVMPFCDGTTLKHRLDRGPLPRKDALAIAAQLADALSYLQSRGIVHGDLKPSN